MAAVTWGGIGPFRDARHNATGAAGGEAEGKGMGWDGNRVVFFFFGGREDGEF